MDLNLNFLNHKVLIAGDVMLDKYYFGKVNRISPEAPVPIVDIQYEEARLGGAANVANNIVSLNGNTSLYGAIGHDFFGKEIERMCRQKNIRANFLKTTSPTITKARILGGKQQIVRLDYEDKGELTPEEKDAFKNSIEESILEHDVIVISDYGKGFVSGDICQHIVSLSKKHNKYVIIDPKGNNWKKYQGADIITPNVKELGDVAGYPVDNTDEEIRKAALKIIRNNSLTALLVTRSEKGMSLVSESESLHIPTHSEEVFDVSGAGDTVVATLSTCIASGMSITEAMQIANIAAGVVVKKIGTATLTLEELKKAYKIWKDERKLS